MKYLIAWIEQERVGEVVQGIKNRLPGADSSRISVSQVTFHGAQSDLAPIYRGFCQPDLPLQRAKLEMILDEEDVRPVLDAIGTDSGLVGDAGPQVVVLDLVSCVAPSAA